MNINAISLNDIMDTRCYQYHHRYSLTRSQSPDPCAGQPYTGLDNERVNYAVVDILLRCISFLCHDNRYIIL